eukprot:4869653-Prymnesium_polylepis.1
MYSKSNDTRNHEQNRSATIRSRLPDYAGSGLCYSGSLLTGLCYSGSDVKSSTFKPTQNHEVPKLSTQAHNQDARADKQRKCSRSS